MGTIRVLILGLLVSFISFGLGESVAAAEKETPKVTMKFSRDVYSGAACLEYSWVPQGKRHTIQLLPGKKEDTQTDSVSADTNPSHVQMYSLSNNQKVGLKMWQFPPGPPRSTPVIRATIEVTDKEVVGTVYYLDGSSASDKHQLDPAAPKCPEVQ
jgi:hypothetical protein